MSEEAESAKEIAKALQEGFKLATQTGSQIGNANSYLAEIFDNRIRYLSGDGPVRAAEFEIRNIINGRDRILRLLKKRGIDESYLKLEEREFFRIVKPVALEDDPDVQELWAEYVVNAMDPNILDIGITQIITNVIAALEPVDLPILRYLFQDGLLELRSDEVELSSASFDIAERSLSFTMARFQALGLFSHENNASMVFATSDEVSVACNVTVQTDLGDFRATALLLLFRDSVKEPNGN
nr:hypothetical protein [Marinicella sp. W31]MDC2878334.1 hypothetical protein [Marinicella sp. W31]